MRTHSEARSAGDFQRPGIWWMAPAAAFVLLAFAVPMLELVRTAGAGGSSHLARELARVWIQGHTRRALLNGVLLSAAVSFVAIALCLAPAKLLAERAFAGRRVARALLSVPLAFSGVIVGFLAIVMLGRVGVVPSVSLALFGRPFGSGLAYALPGLFLAYLFFEIPRAVLALEAAFSRIDPELEDAARTLGAGTIARLRRVTLPTLGPALAGTFASTFAVSLGSYGAALVLSRRFSVLPVEIYQELTAFSNDAGACAMALWLAAISIAVTFSAARSSARA